MLKLYLTVMFIKIIISKMPMPCCSISTRVYINMETDKIPLIILYRKYMFTLINLSIIIFRTFVAFITIFFCSVFSSILEFWDYFFFYFISYTFLNFFPIFFLTAWLTSTRTKLPQIVGWIIASFEDKVLAFTLLLIWSVFKKYSSKAVFSSSIL